MDKIYIIAIPTGRSSYGIIQDAEPTGDTYGVAIKDNGAILAAHLSSGANWTRHDMGITSNWKHDVYEKECPNGYELEWVDFYNWKINEGFKSVLSLVKEEVPFLSLLKAMLKEE